MGKLVAPAIKLDHVQVFTRYLQTLVFVKTAYFQWHGNVVKYRAMWHQSEVLEYHGNVFVSVASQLRLAEGHNVVAINTDGACCRFE